MAETNEVRVDVGPANGLAFEAKSGNVCLFKQDTKSCLIANWASKPTDADISECDAWIAKILDANVHSRIGGPNNPENIANSRRIHEEIEKRNKTSS